MPIWQAGRSLSVLRSVAKTPAKQEENGGFGYSNSNGDGKDPAHWGQEAVLWTGQTAARPSVGPTEEERLKVLKALKMSEAFLPRRRADILAM